MDDAVKDHYGLSSDVLDSMAARQKLVVEIRNIRAQFRIPANRKLNVVFQGDTDMAPDEKAVIQLLVGADSIAHRPEYQPSKGEPVVYPGMGGKLYIPIAGLFDVDAEKARLAKELQKIDAEIGKVQTKLGNPDFAKKVPPQVLQEHQQRLADWQAKRGQLQSSLESLNS